MFPRSPHRACGGHHARAQKVTPKITVSYTSFNMPAAIVWIAKENRLSVKSGLNGELISPGGTTAMSALVSGNIDFAQLTGRQQILIMSGTH